MLVPKQLLSRPDYESVTRVRLASHLRQIGVTEGGVLMVHVRLSAFGWVVRCIAISGSSTSLICWLCQGALNRASRARARRPVGAPDSPKDEVDSPVDVLVGPTVANTARADRFGRINRAVVVDPDASCPLGRCVVAAHELQSLRYQQAQTDVANAC